VALPVSGSKQERDTEKREAMLIKLSTDKTVSEAAVALQAAVQANHFGVMQAHTSRKP
jgi:hypothetical protein